MDKVRAVSTLARGMHAVGRLAALTVRVLLAAPACASALTATSARIAAHPGSYSISNRVGGAQTGTLEALAQSAKDGSLASLVQVRAGLNP